MASRLRRRTFLATAAAGLFSTAVRRQPRSLGAEMDHQTFTYKTVGECPINADVHNGSRGSKRPVAVWIHGGALIMGNRRGIDNALLAKLIDAGFVVVSIDYRLAPET